MLSQNITYRHGLTTTQSWIMLPLLSILLHIFAWDQKEYSLGKESHIVYFDWFLDGKSKPHKPLKIANKKISYCFYNNSNNNHTRPVLVYYAACPTSHIESITAHIPAATTTPSQPISRYIPVSFDSVPQVGHLVSRIQNSLIQWQHQQRQEHQSSGGAKMANITFQKLLLLLLGAYVYFLPWSVLFFGSLHWSFSPVAAASTSSKTSTRVTGYTIAGGMIALWSWKTVRKSDAGQRECSTHAAFAKRTLCCAAYLREKEDDSARIKYWCIAPAKITPISEGIT